LACVPPARRAAAVFVDPVTRFAVPASVGAVVPRAVVAEADRPVDVAVVRRAAVPVLAAAAGSGRGPAPLAPGARADRCLELFPRVWLLTTRR
jgi:hypothetical protein